VIDHDGIEWLPVSEAAHRIGVQRGRIYVWIQRHGGQRLDLRKDRGRVWVRMVDVYHLEAAWRREQARRATRRADE
jgi:hypothetical protein